MTVNYRGINTKGTHPYTQLLRGRTALKTALSRLTNGLKYWQLYKGHLDYQHHRAYRPL